MENNLATMERGAVATSQRTQSTSLLQAISAAASDPTVDLDKVERLFKLHKELVGMEAETAFNGALARAQARMVPVANNATNDQTHSRYAKLAAINTAITPIYTEEGFSISFDSGDCPVPGYLRVLAMLSHSGGHTRQYHLDMPPDDVGMQGRANKTKVHATGSTNSYARRYLVCMIFNVTTEDDTDGNRSTPTSGAADRVDPERRAEIRETVSAVKKFLADGCVADAVVEKENAGFDADETVFFWTFFDSKERSAMKREFERIHAETVKEPKLVSEAQHKRLEARIAENKLDREKIKQFCFERFNKSHFNELNVDEYAALDIALDKRIAADQIATQP